MQRIYIGVRVCLLHVSDMLDNTVCVVQYSHPEHTRLELLLGRQL